MSAPHIAAMRPSEFIAYLVTHGCLPMVAGAAPQSDPPQGEMIAPGARAGLGFQTPGVTIRYRVAGGDVLADWGAQTATFQDDGADLGAGLKDLESALSAAPAAIELVQDLPSAAEPGRNVRIYSAMLTEERLARIEIGYSRALGAAPGLWVKVTGLERALTPT